jgi:hypothetical protein
MKILEATFPGLIDCAEGDRSELHGFEVDLAGRVVLPEFSPARLKTGALRPFIDFDSAPPRARGAGGSIRPGVKGSGTPGPRW